jgi:predicted DNA-binding ribbon-helix-helix protein
MALTFNTAPERRVSLSSATMAKPRHKRSITIAGHRTSVSLEAAFWQALGALAETDGRSVADLVSEIDQARTGPDRAGMKSSETSLSAAIRLYVLERMRRPG